MLAYINYPAWIRPEIIPWLPIRWYGLMYLVAFAVTYLLFTWQLRQRQISVAKDVVLDMFFWAIIGLLVGARANLTGYTGPWLYVPPWLQKRRGLAISEVVDRVHHGAAARRARSVPRSRVRRAPLTSATERR